MHTPLGYWNETYHHGTWFQTTAFRPLVEDRNVLPQQKSARNLPVFKKSRGSISSTNISVANGRGKAITENQNLQDNNGNKAFQSAADASAGCGPRTQFESTTTMTRSRPIPPFLPETARSRAILGGHFVYTGHNFEFLSEYANIRHEDEVSGNTYTTNGFISRGRINFNGGNPNTVMIIWISAA